MMREILVHVSDEPWKINPIAHSDLFRFCLFLYVFGFEIFCGLRSGQRVHAEEEFEEVMHLQKEKPFDDDSNQGREEEKRKKKKTLNIVL